MSALNPFLLARELAKPVRHGWLDADNAEAALLINSIRAVRQGDMTGDAVGIASAAAKLMQLHIQHGVRQ